MSTDKTVPPPPANSPAWFADFKAKAEEANWDKEGKLRGQEERNQLLWLKAYGFVVFLFLVFFSLLFVGSLGSWALHYLLPVSWHWLDTDQLSKIQSILFSGSIGGVVSIIAQKQLSK
jgi:Fe2+ transport system protein B